MLGVRARVGRRILVRTFDYTYPDVWISSAWELHLGKARKHSGNLLIILKEG